MPEGSYTKNQVWYPVLMFGLGVCHQMITQWAVFFYAPPLSAGATVFLNIGLISAAMALGRVVAALSDPLVAFMSDRFSSRLGRRKPFMFWGVPFLLLSFLLLWYPPVKHATLLNFFWAALAVSIFFFSYSLITAPYLALLPEMTDSEMERIKLSTLQMSFYGGGAGLGFLFSTIFGPSLGLPKLVLIYFPFIAFSLIWPSLMIKENPSLQPQETPNFGWREALRSLKDDRVFMFWNVTQAFIWTALIMLVMLMPYLLTVILKVSSPSLISLPAVVVVVAGSTANVLFVFKEIKSKGKENIYQNVLIAAGFVLVLISAVGLKGLPGTPQLQAAVLFALLAGPLALLLALPNAVVAEISERRLAQHEERMEALLYAGQGFIVKLSMAGGSALLGFLLFYFGSTIEASLGIRLASLLAGILLLLSTLFFRKFRKYKD
ncbi:MAG: MFS transporter [Dethiobacteria bacterium]|jgi:GPH family glycoside/pentoside/hexuronide:cation symporter